MKIETQILFHNDPYQTSTKAWLDEVIEGEPGQLKIVLSQTLFYPQGGGQKGDRGWLIIESENGKTKIPVSDTKKDEGLVYHIVTDTPDTRALLQDLVGNCEIETEIDWEFRYHQMRIHSVGHLVHCFLEKTLGRAIAYPSRSPLDESGGENQYDALNPFLPEELERATSELNAFLLEDHKIITMPDEGSGAGFRRWQCEAWNIPCGGIHPKSTKEIGQVKTGMREKKKQTRVSFQII